MNGGEWMAVSTFPGVPVHAIRDGGTVCGVVGHATPGSFYEPRDDNTVCLRCSSFLLNEFSEAHCD